MAKLPIYTQKYQPDARRAAAEDFGAIEGRAKSGFGQALGQLSEVFARSEDAANDARKQSVDAMAQAKLIELRHRVSNDPEYDLHGDKYQKGVEEIKLWAQEQIGDDATYGIWQPTFEPHVIREGVKLSTSTIKMQVTDAQANTQSTLNTLTSLASETDSPTEKRIYIDKGLKSIQAQEDAGIYTPAEALKAKNDFLSDVAGAEIRREIRLDPNTAYMRLQDSGDPINKGLTPEKREVWISRAVKAYEADLRKQDINERRLERKAEKADKIRADELSKEAMTLLANDDLDLDWLEENRSKMYPADYRYYMDKLEGIEESEDVSLYYVELDNAAKDGRDVRADADMAYLGGNISKEQRDHVVRVVENGFNTNAKMAQDLLETSFGKDETIEIPGMRVRKAKAMLELNRYIQDNPGRTTTEYVEKAESILKDYHWTPSAMDIFSLPRLRFGPDIPTPNMDLTSIATKTKEALINGDISDEDFAGQVQLLKQYKQAIENSNKSLKAK